MTTTVGSGTTITGGSLNVISNVYQQAQSDGLSASGGIIFGLGIVAPTATVGGSITTSFNGSATGLSSANVKSIDEAHAIASGRAAGGAGLVGATSATLSATVGPNVTTSVNGTIAASGGITIESSLTASALGDYEALSFGVFAGAGTDTVNATDDSTVEAKVGGSGNVTSSSGDVNVLAYHNYDGTSFETGQTVTTHANAITVSLGLSISSNNLTSTAEATTKAEVDSGGNIAALGHTANVKAFSGDYAFAFVQNSNGAILNISVDSNPTSVASGDTEANLNGNVTGVSGPGADTLNVIAQGNDDATAGMKEDGGGLLSVTNSQSHSSGSPTSAVILGGGGSTIETGHDITASAFESYDSDSSTSSATGGAINVSGFTATAGMTPTSMASVTGGATITSDNGSISVDATANQPPAPVSDGHFDAGGIDNSTHTITFLCNGTPCASNATTGDPVTYQADGGGVVGGLHSGRTYAVIVTGPEHRPARRHVRRGRRRQRQHDDRHDRLR